MQPKKNIKMMNAIDLQKEVDQCLDQVLNNSKLMRLLGYKSSFSMWRAMAETGLKIVYDEFSNKPIVYNVPKREIRKKRKNK